MLKDIFLLSFSICIEMNEKQQEKEACFACMCATRSCCLEHQAEKGSVQFLKNKWL